MKQPPLGWTTPATVAELKDGDTIVVEIKRTFILRLIDDEIYFDTPETYRPQSEEERVAGLAATEYLRKLLFKRDEQGNLVPKNIVVHIPTDGSGKMDQITQFSRYHAQIWADGVDVVDEMIKAGFIKEENSSG